MKKLGLALTISALIAFILVTICIENMASAYKSNRFSNTITAASKQLTKLKRDSNEVFAIQKELNKFYGLLSEEHCNLNVLTKRCNEFESSGYGFVNLRFFDKQQSRLAIKSSRQDDGLNGAMQRLYTALSNSKLKGDDSMLKQYRSLFETLLGAVDLHQLVKQTSTIIPVTLSGKPGYFYWNVYENPAVESEISGMVAWVRKADIPARFFCQKLVDEYNQKSYESDEKQVFGFVDTNVNGLLYPENIVDTVSGFYYAELILKLQELKACLRSHDQIADRIFSYIELGNGRFFFCLSQTADYTILRFLTSSFEGFLFISVLAFAIYSIMLFHKLSEELEKHTLYSRRFFTTEILSAFFLIIFLIVMNVFVARLSNKNYKDFIYTNLTSVIDWLDDGFVLAKKDLSEKWMNIARDQSVIHLQHNAIDNIARTLAQERELTKMFIADKEGQLLYSFPQSQNDNIFNRLIPVVARKIAQERFGTDETWKTRIDSLMVNSFSQSFTDLLGEGATDILRAFETFDTATELDFGNKKHIVFSTTIDEKSENPKLLIVWLDAEPYCHDYIVSKIKDAETLPPNLRQTVLAMVPVHLDSLPYPKEITKYSFTRDITERVNFTKRQVEFETNLAGMTYYGVGTLLHSAPNYVVFALQPSN